MTVAISDFEPAAFTAHPPIQRLPTSHDLEQVRSKDSSEARKLFRNVMFLGCSFSLVFTGYHVAQSFVTTVYHGTFGFTALGIIYGCFAISSFLAPIVHQYAEYYGGPGRGEKLSMIAGSFGYILFIITLAVGIKWLFIIGCIVKGLSSGLLWISEGVWLTKSVNAYRDSCTPPPNQQQQHQKEESNQQKPFEQSCHDEDAILTVEEDPSDSNKDENDVVGRATGLFFTLFNMNGIIGNLLSLLLLAVGVTVSSLIWIMAIITTFGSSMMTLASNAPASRRASAPTLQVFSEKIDIMDALKERWRLITQVAGQYQTRLLTPYFFCQGVHLAYTYGNFPNFLSYAEKMEPQLVVVEKGSGHSAINIVAGFLLYGVGSMIGAYGWGKIYDMSKSKLKPLLFSHLFLQSVIASLLISMVLAPFPSTAMMPILLLIGFLFGLLDFLVNAISNNSISKFYATKEVSSAFGWYRIAFCVGFALASGCSGLIPSVDDSLNAKTSWEKYGWLVMISVNYGAMLISVLTGFWAERCLREQHRADSDVVSVH